MTGGTGRGVDRDLAVVTERGRRGEAPGWEAGASRLAVGPAVRTVDSTTYGSIVITQVSSSAEERREIGKEFRASPHRSKTAGAGLGMSPEVGVRAEQDHARAG